VRGWERRSFSNDSDKKREKMKAILTAETKAQLNATLPQLFKLAVMMLNDYAAAVEEEADGVEVIPPAATPAPTPAPVATPGPSLVPEPVASLEGASEVTDPDAPETEVEEVVERKRDRGKNATN
jgi:hypothetical protein